MSVVPVHLKIVLIIKIAHCYRYSNKTISPNSVIIILHILANIWPFLILFLNHFTLGITHTTHDVLWTYEVVRKMSQNILQPISDVKKTYVVWEVSELIKVFNIF